MFVFLVHSFYFFIFSDSNLDTVDGKQDLPVTDTWHPSPVTFNQSPSSINMNDSRQAGLSWDAYGISLAEGHNRFDRTPEMAPPYEYSLIPTPDFRSASQLASQPVQMDRSTLPSNLIDQSHTMRAPIAPGVDQSHTMRTPIAPGVDQSVATSALIDRNLRLPGHLADQSSFRFPDMGVSRVYPTEEEELEDLMLRLDEAYPVNFTYGKILNSS